MAAEIKKDIPREFRLNKNGTTVNLPDPNPEFTAEEVIQFYSVQYPELTTANVEGPAMDGNKAVYSVKSTIGTKG